MPTLFKIFTVFALILILSRKGVPLFLCLFAGAFAIGIGMGIGPGEVVTMILEEVTSARVLWLVLIITAILVLSNLMEQAGHLHRLVEAFNRLSPSRRFTTVAMPAVIGLLPMPGGALFSAPMVEESFPGEGSPELKTAVNYWFRHIWEYWWPLYPGVVLAISLLGVEAWRFIVAQLPLTVGAVTAGGLFIARLIPSAPGGRVSGGALKGFLWEMVPIGLVLLFLFGLRALAPLCGLHTSKYLGFAVGLLAAILWVSLRYDLEWEQWRRAIFKPSLPKMAMMVFGIMAFKGVLVRSSAIGAVKTELGLYGVPTLAIVVVLPFVSGFVTGIAIGFVGTSFPLVASLVEGGRSFLAYGVLAYGFGYMGMMLTPLHLCFLVTKDYFRADLLGSYRYLWRAALFVLGWTVTLFLIYVVAGI